MLDTATMILYSNVSSLNEIRYILTLTAPSLIIILYSALLVYTGLILHARNSDDDYVQPFIRGGSWISGKGVHMYKGVGVSFADFISFFLYIP